MLFRFLKRVKQACCAVAFIVLSSSTALHSAFSIEENTHSFGVCSLSSAYYNDDPGAGNFSIVSWVAGEQSSSISDCQVIKASIFNGKSWSEPVTISTGYDSISIDNHHASINMYGQGAVAWSCHEANSEKSVYVAIYENGCWSCPSKISIEPALEINDCLVAVDTFGDRIVVWDYQDGVSDNRKIGSRYYEDGAWKLYQEVISLESASVQKIDLRISLAGSIMLMWTEVDQASNNQLYLRYSLLNTLTGVWMLPGQVYRETGRSVVDFDFDLDAGGNGVVVIASQILDEPLETCYSLDIKTYTAGSFSNLSSAIDSGSSFYDHLKVKIDGSGSGYVSWTQSLGEIYKLYLMKLNNRAPIGEPSSLTSAFEGFQSTDLAISREGAAAVTWSFFDDGCHRIKTLYKTPSSDDWISSKELIGTFSKVAYYDRENFVGFYSLPDSDATNFQLCLGQYQNTLKAPSDFQGEVIRFKLGIWYHYVYQLTWQPSTSENVAYYRLYKGDHLISIVEAGKPLVYYDVLVNRDVITTYKLVAVDSELNESEGVSLVLSGLI